LLRSWITRLALALHFGEEIIIVLIKQTAAVTTTRSQYDSSILFFSQRNSPIKRYAILWARASTRKTTFPRW